MTAELVACASQLRLISLYAQRSKYPRKRWPLCLLRGSDSEWNQETAKFLLAEPLPITKIGLENSKNSKVTMPVADSQ
jgi:hypothetical protein